MNQITLLLPTDTPIPVVGGIEERQNGRWVRVAGKRWTRRRSGLIEASYDLETLRFCIAWADRGIRL